MPVAGGSEALITAADALDATSGRLLEHRDAVATRVGGVLGTWSGAPAPVARARVGTDVAALARAADACRVVVPALRAWADELHRAQADWTQGERMVTAAQGGDPAGERVQLDLEAGWNVMLGAEERAAVAEEIAARVFDEATAMLAGIVPPQEPAPAADGDLGDGLRKAGHDVISEIGEVLGGVLAHANVFSEHWGDTWSETARTAAAAVTHPVEAARVAVEGTVAPIGESYRSGGLDEAIGRTPGVIATVLGGKGLTKLGSSTRSNCPRLSSPARASPSPRTAGWPATSSSVATPCARTSGTSAPPISNCSTAKPVKAATGSPATPTAPPPNAPSTRT